jgi:CelD/BcsL family acetyltransferase involved in cellulose biosynthesis
MTVTQSLSKPRMARESENPLVELHAGPAAVAWLSDEANIAAWARLESRCPWSVAFLGPDFYRVWVRNYQNTWQPLLLTMTDAHGLSAVMPLGVRDGLVTGAGAHQADYHGWVWDETADGELFLREAFAKITAAFPRHTVRLRYLPPETPAAAIEQLRRIPRASIRPSHRHTIKLDRGEIEGSLKKKGNKSKANRIKRGGKLEYRNLDLAEFTRWFDDVIEMYDFRQGALINSCPFRDDPSKKAFHLDWIRALPKQLVANGMFLNDKLISILVYVVSKSEVHLAIVAHAPEHGDNSPNKIQMYEHGLTLIGGFERIDLTPGGEDWKARFSEVPEPIIEFTIHGSSASAAVTRTSQYLDKLAHKVAADLKVPVSDLKALGRRGAALPGNLWQRMTRAPEQAPSRYEIALGPLTVEWSPLIRVDPLSLLLDHGPKLAGVDRQTFLSRAWFRIEGGDRCYVLPGADGIAALAWRSRVDDKLFDFLLRDSESARVLVQSMLFDLKAENADRSATIVVPQGDAGLRAIVEALGGVRIA